MSQEIDLTVIGKRQPRLDGAEKCSGRSVFADDVELAGHAVRQDLAQPARACTYQVHRHNEGPGAAGRQGGDNCGGCPGHHGHRRGAEPVFASDTVTYKGREVAGVAALDERTAEKALQLIDRIRRVASRADHAPCAQGGCAAGTGRQAGQYLRQSKPTTTAMPMARCRCGSRL